MNDAQLKNIIHFETELSKIHGRRAKIFADQLKNQRQRRAKRTAKIATENILERLSEQTSKQ